MSINILQTLSETFKKTEGYTCAKFGCGPNRVVIDVQFDSKEQVIQRPKPISIRIVRPDKSIRLSYQEEMYQGSPIILASIEAFDRKYGIYKTTIASNGIATQKGNERALESCRNDSIIARYIDFMDDKHLFQKKREIIPWNLVKDMEQSRQ